MFLLNLCWHLIISPLTNVLKSKVQWSLMKLFYFCLFLTLLATSTFFFSKKPGVFMLSHSSCPALCYPMDCRPPGSSVHRIFQARILEWVAVFFSSGSSQPRDGTHIFCIGRQVLYHWASRHLYNGILCSYFKMRMLIMYWYGKSFNI